MDGSKEVAPTVQGLCPAGLAAVSRFVSYEVSPPTRGPSSRVPAAMPVLAPTASPRQDPYKRGTASA